MEDYRLDTLVIGVPVGVYDPNAAQTLRGKEPGGKSTDQTSQTSPAKSPSSSGAAKATVVHGTEPIAVINSNPEEPYVAPLTAKEEKQLFMLQHPKRTYNGLKFIDAREGDYNGVRLYIEERKKYDESFKDYCVHHNRKELCILLTKEFGWFVDDKSLGRNIQRNI